ncbi:MAG: hypothetical protein K1X64_22995 [Myxococcaceae bacterium]|nr:hypothetical protein [Myxococcaceae bacterium]
MKRARWLAMLSVLATTGCLATFGRASAAPLQPVQVSDVVLTFGESGKADLSFVATVTPESDLFIATEVQWELWLDGRYFAAGVWRVEVPLVQGAPTHLPIRTPLVFRPGPVKNETMPVSVGLKGFVVGQTRVRSMRESFSWQEVQWVAGSPVWDTGKLFP